jgi:hypothetical protein
MPLILYRLLCSLLLECLLSCPGLRNIAGPLKDNNTGAFDLGIIFYLETLQYDQKSAKKRINVSVFKVVSLQVLFL